jgi:hypothetical protein
MTHALCLKARIHCVPVAGSGLNKYKSSESRCWHHHLCMTCSLSLCVFRDVCWSLKCFTNLSLLAVCRVLGKIVGPAGLLDDGGHRNSNGTRCQCPPSQSLQSWSNCAWQIVEVCILVNFWHLPLLRHALSPFSHQGTYFLAQTSQCCSQSSMCNARWRVCHFVVLTRLHPYWLSKVLTWNCP